MRVYLGGASRPKLRKARQAAPSHVFGITWTPHDTRLSQIPYFVDNGAFTDSFDPDEWLSLLDDLSEYGYGPDFIVLPDVLNDAIATVEKHREWADTVAEYGFPMAYVLQPGMPVETQVRLADSIGAKFVFVGGKTRWQRAHGAEIVETAHAHDLVVHIGNPSGEDGLSWAYKNGFDSADTSTITQSGYWHYLEELEEVTADHRLSNTPRKKGEQATLLGGGSLAG